MGMKSKLLGRACILLALAGILGLGNVANADSVTFIGSGSVNNGTATNTLSAKAKFTVSGDTLTLKLDNTTALSALNANLRVGDTLTGILFDVSGAPALHLTSTAISAGSKLYTSQSSSGSTSTNINGSWTDQLGGSPPSGEYGVATTGFGGVFKASGITLGGAQTDYGLLTSGYPVLDPHHQSSFNKFPYILNSITFTFSGATGVTGSQISGVEFLFGTPEASIAGNPSVPEPSTMALAAVGLTALGAHGWRRKRARR
jgi:hypothetical protein